MQATLTPVKLVPEDTSDCGVEYLCVKEDPFESVKPIPVRKKIFYLDFDHVEFGEYLSKMQERTREALCTSRDMDSFVFWFDIGEGLKTLTNRQRECFVAHFIEGYGEDEIAQKLQLSQPVIHRHIEKARKKMKTFLIEGGYKNGSNCTLY